MADLIARLAVVMACVTAASTAGCRGRVVSSDSEPAPLRASYEIRQPDLAPDPRYVPGSRQAEYDSAMTELLAGLPTDQDRAQVRRMLENPTEHLPNGSVAMTRAGATGDRRSSELISTIYEIQAKEAMARELQRSREMAMRSPVAVTITRVEQLPLADVRVVVQVRARASPSLLILLRHDAGVEELAAAVQRLSEHRREYGDLVWRDTTLRVPSHSGARSWVDEAYLGQRLAELRTVQPRPIAGLGTVRAIEIELGPVMRQER